MTDMVLYPPYNVTLTIDGIEYTYTNPDKRVFYAIQVYTGAKALGVTVGGRLKEYLKRNADNRELTL